MSLTDVKVIQKKNVKHIDVSNSFIAITY